MISNKTNSTLNNSLQNSIKVHQGRTQRGQIATIYRSRDDSKFNDAASLEAKSIKDKLKGHASLDCEPPRQILQLGKSLNLKKINQRK